MSTERRADVLADLVTASIPPAQSDFCLPPAHVLDKCRADPSRRPFAILVLHDDAMRTAGLGVLHPGAADGITWPERSPHVLLRGFAVDSRWQGRGIGTSAAAAAVALTRARFSWAEAVVLTVHEGNEAGKRAYERAGFAYTGTRIIGRTGPELVMACPVRPTGSR